MKLNFKEALAALANALPVVFFRAGFYIAGGFMIIVLFGMTLFVLRLAGGASSTAATVVIALALLGGLMAVWIGQRFFLYRRQADLLFLFSGRRQLAPGFPAVEQAAGRLFPDHSSWMLVNRGVRQAIVFFYRRGGEFFALPAAPSVGSFFEAIDFLAAGMLSQAIISLVFAREGNDAAIAIREGLALYFRHGGRSRRLARRWLGFSLAVLALLFLCLAVSNWLFFRAAGAPVVIGIILAAAIAWLLQQAFVVPVVLAGICAALLAETHGQNPEPSICDKLSSLLPTVASPSKKSPS